MWPMTYIFFLFLTRTWLPTVSVILIDDEPGLLTDKLIDSISNDSSAYWLLIDTMTDNLYYY